jgi:ATP dependent DNA ligase-like protein
VVLEELKASIPARERSQFLEDCGRNGSTEMPNKSFPQFVAPMQASSMKDPFDSPDWVFETKLDGYRAIAVIDSVGKARIWSRNRLPLEPKFPMILNAVDRLKLRSTILDGEIVALDQEGIPRFQLLQQWQKRLNGIAKKHLEIPKMIPQDLTQCAANDLDIFSPAMPKVIPAHPIDNIALFIDEYGSLHIGMRRNNGVMNPHLPENLQSRPAHIDLITANQQRRRPLHDGRAKPIAPQPIGGGESCGSGA